MHERRGPGPGPGLASFPYRPFSACIIRGEALDPAVEHAPAHRKNRTPAHVPAVIIPVQVDRWRFHLSSSSLPGFSDWVSVSVSHTLARVKMKKKKSLPPMPPHLLRNEDASQASLPDRAHSGEATARIGYGELGGAPPSCGRGLAMARLNPFRRRRWARREGARRRVIWHQELAARPAICRLVFSRARGSAC